jgi:hypothetical protein
MRRRRAMKMDRANGEERESTTVHGGREGERRATVAHASMGGGSDVSDRDTDGQWVYTRGIARENKTAKQKTRNFGDQPIS